ncbi:recombinase family protein [Mesobacillus subterraneus]|uniref:Recombinase family protein n=2 Tax=Mesobacillus subterraneus TaxID=285983 RepID=A0A427TDD8_9BACI|nr:recombinase family protein [Mesobacillus subterraneus]
MDVVNSKPWDRELEIAAIYVRVSTMKESQKDSPEHQRSLCEEKARMEGLDVQSEFIYEDRSTGTSIAERADIKLLIEDAKKGRFKTVIFSSLSRFSRDAADALYLKRQLVNALGLRLISIEDGYDSKDKDDEMIFTIIAAVNQKLSEQLSISSRRGIRESAKKGNFVGSRAPFGYKKVNKIEGGNERKTLAISPNEAEVVHKIFDQYVNHNMGEKQIVNYLNEEEIPSPKGGVWGITTIQRILQNEAYIGLNVFGKYTVKKVYEDLNDMQKRKKTLVQKDKGIWERNVEKKWEAIIKEETFLEAQKIRLERGGGKRGGARNVQVNPFSGIIKCEHCGSNFVSMKSGKVGKEGQEYRYLICSSRRRMGVKGCKNGLWIPLEEFKNEVLKEITKSLDQLINVEEISSNVELPAKKGKENKEKKRNQLEKMVANYRKYLMDLRMETKFPNEKTDHEQIKFELMSVENQIKETQEKLQNLLVTEDENNKEEIIKKQVKDGLAKLVKLEFEDVAELQLVLKQLIDEIKIDMDGEVEIYTPLGILQS